MERSIYIRLSQEVLEQLGELARRERRDPRDQGAILIEQALRDQQSAAGRLNERDLAIA